MFKTILLPKWIETGRLLMKTATIDEVDQLQELYETSSYMADWVGKTIKEDDMKQSLLNPELPPQGNLDNVRMMSVYVKVNAQLIGILDFYHGYPTERAFYLGLLYLHPNQQAQGYGREIIDELEKQVWNAGYHAIRLGVALKNWPALRFWIRIGYTTISRITGDTVFGEDNVALIELVKGNPHL